jgi:exodeoxyribonuclease VII large subunit
MLQILARRNRGIDVLIVPVRVQGTGAAREIVDGIKLINTFAKRSGEVDVIIIGRGGGSMEDLWAFNEESVARAIFESEIPVVSAVGHETDYTIADFVADFRAPTPSAAAEIVAKESSLLRSKIDNLQKELFAGINNCLLKRRSEVRDLIESRGFADTANAFLRLSTKRRELEKRASDALKMNLQNASLRFAKAKQCLAAIDFRASVAIKSARLGALNQRMAAAVDRRLESGGRRLAVAAGKLEMLSPLSVLARGYTIVKDEQGRLVFRAADVSSGQDLTLRFEDGEVGCQVK